MSLFLARQLGEEALSMSNDRIAKQDEKVGVRGHMQQ